MRFKSSKGSSRVNTSVALQEKLCDRVIIRSLGMRPIHSSLRDFIHLNSTSKRKQLSYNLRRSTGQVGTTSCCLASGLTERKTLHELCSSDLLLIIIRIYLQLSNQEKFINSILCQICMIERKKNALNL